ncbi:DNA polymerase III subunit chi [Acidithiobacillus sp. AMEEHan]|uniref:DNA polymerase III subunit chi n=1 Tax=Acidithiobacillus sp. AMEEHan TaxID=2994951 RepID=UPI0027E554B6|nr:DNA polymerase III subunit chi [Acidithiobacillus sp. AMEEHan]
MSGTANFYQLPAVPLPPLESRRAICRVITKAWQVLGKVDVLAADAELVAAYDDLLWTFHAGVFLPHGQAAQEPVYLFADPQQGRADARALVLLEWPQELPVLDRMKRLIDFIPGAEEERAAARARYLQCKRAGFSIQLFPLEV